MNGPELGSEVLQRAAAALRAAHDGQREGSGFTRARILATVAERRRPRLRRWLVLAPLGSALLVGSAWAQSTGSWPRVWQAVAAVLPFIEPRRPAERPRAPLERTPPSIPAPREPRVAPPPAAVEPPSEGPARGEPPAPATQPEAELEGKPAPVPPRPARARRPSTSPGTESAPAAPTTAADPELRRFRAAHELHVQGQPRAAIAAYQEYLQAYPSGRFVPEARYNSALDAIKLGDYDSARRSLQPFADGEFGGYRRAEAQRLLEALAGEGRR